MSTRAPGPLGEPIHIERVCQVARSPVRLMRQGQERRPEDVALHPQKGRRGDSGLIPAAHRSVKDAQRRLRQGFHLSSCRRTTVRQAPPAAANCCLDMVARLAEGLSSDGARQQLQMLHERFAAADARRARWLSSDGVRGQAGRNDLPVLPMIVAGLSCSGMPASAASNSRATGTRARGRDPYRNGATRGRVIRQLLVERLVLAGIAAAAVVPAAYLRTRLNIVERLPRRPHAGTGHTGCRVLSLRPCFFRGFGAAD